MPVATKTDIDAFAAKVTAFLADHHVKAKNAFAPPTIEVMMGPKLARLVMVGPAQRSVYAFVEIATGAIYKAAGWKAPAKHVRGNIFDANPLACCTPYGIVYLR